MDKSRRPGVAAAFKLVVIDSTHLNMVFAAENLCLIRVGPRAGNRIEHMQGHAFYLYQ